MSIRPHQDRVEPESPKTGGRAHVPALDGVRGVAILMVLIHHFTPTFADAPWIASSPLRWLHAGWIGVDLFFVLSGYLITGILLEDRGRPGYFRDFYARRTLRIFPLYYGVLFAVLVIVPAFLAAAGRPASRLGELGRELQDIRAHQAWLWLYVSNFATAIFKQDWYFLGHFWSLAIEEHFYLIWPATVALLRGRALVAGCLAVIVGALVVRVAIIACGMEPGICYSLTPCRLDGLALGGLIAAVLRGRTLPPGASRAALALSLAVLAAALAGLAWSGSVGRESLIVNGPGYTVLSVAWGAFLIAAIASRPGGLLNAALSSPILAAFGKYSYGLYVYNRLLMLPIKRVAPTERLGRILGSPFLGVAAHAAIGIAVTFAVAFASYHLFEARFLRLKRHFARR